MKFNGKAVLGIAVSLLLLWWALRDVSFEEVMHHVRNADPVLFGLAIVLATAGLAVRALRWSVLLRPIRAHVPFRPRFAATSIGFAANNLLPARVGEFARALSLGRLTGIPVAAVFGSLALERVLDGVALVTLLFLSLPGVPVDPRTAAGLAVVGVVGTGVLAATVLFLAFAPERSIAVGERVAVRILPGSFARRLVDGLRSFVTALAVLRDPKLFVLSVLWAFGQWTFLALSYFVALRAFGIDQVSFLGAVFLQSLVSFGVAVPSSPGFFGPFEAVVKLGLAVWSVPAGQAVSFAIGFHIGGFIPVTLIGLWYVWRLDLRWKDVERSEETVETIVEHDPTVPGTSVRRP